MFSQQFLLGPFSGQTTVGEDEIPGETMRSNAENLQLAISSRDYPVTPGDVYMLSFIMAGNPVTNTLLVESDYTINLDVLGKIDAKDMTFPALKPIIELIIADAYPRSMPSLTIRDIGSFQVAITGAVPQTRYLTAWGLSRLSETIVHDIGPYSSIRDITIKSVDGNEKQYDLLTARNLGILSEDPYLRPGDTIVFSQVQKRVQVSGQVLRPGEYQMKESETTSELLQYVGGLTLTASYDRIRINKNDGEISVSSFASFDELQSGIELNDGDRIIVNSEFNNRPVVFVEGALILGDPEVVSTTDSAAITEDYNRIIYEMGIGDTLFDILEVFKDSLSNEADLEHGYIIRGNHQEPIRIDMQKLLYGFDFNENIALEPFDRIAIPVRTPFVNVVGAVVTPGRYPYNPSRDALAYASLAGGIDVERNSGQKYKIVTEEGDVKEPGDPILAGDTVDILTNNFWYHFGERFGPITTAALFITSAIALINIVNNND